MLIENIILSVVFIVACAFEQKYIDIYWNYQDVTSNK